ncbi:MAG: hypothetical protein M0Q38_08995 [Bacteroidales bacterium]|jgi:energy-converting hydrogenase Eha subunit A|nr:hypothetical protein [Bacteroidales bacterium]
METQFSQKESLDLINQMISSAKNNLHKGMSNIFLLWGYLVAIISLLIFILLLTLPGDTRYFSYWLWIFMAAGAPIHWKLVSKIDQQQLVKTYIDKIMGFVWIAFSVSIIAVVAGMLLSTILVLPVFTDVDPSHEFLRWIQWTFITPFMLCLYGFALFVSGKAYQFKPLVIGGIVCWIATAFLIIAFHHPYLLMIQQIVLFICAVAGFVIPGHLLKQKENSHV